VAIPISEVALSALALSTHDRQWGWESSVGLYQDLWLAAQAVQRDFTLLTANAKDFQDVPDLKLVVVKGA